MNEQVLCRICFASDNVKLCSVFSFGLTEAYEKFVGLKVFIEFLNNILHYVANELFLIY